MATATRAALQASCLCQHCCGYRRSADTGTEPQDRLGPLAQLQVPAPYIVAQRTEGKSRRRNETVYRLAFEGREHEEPVWWAL